MLRTRRSASRLVSSSIWRISRAASWRAWSSSSLSSTCLALDADIPETRSSDRSSSWRVPATRLAFVLELGLAARQLRLAARQPGFSLGQRRGALVRLGLRRGRAGDRRLRRGDAPGAGAAPCAGGCAGPVDAAVQHRCDHDSHRDQRCGPDDFHGRSSPGRSGAVGPGPDSRLPFLGATERPCEAHERMPGSARRGAPSGGGYLAGSMSGVGGRLARVKLPSTLIPVSNITRFAGVLWPLGHSFATRIVVPASMARKPQPPMATHVCSVDRPP